MYKYIATLLSVMVLVFSSSLSFANSEDSAQYVKSSTITAEVKSKLLADPDIKSLKISVKTIKGKVILTGYVKSQQQKENAESITSQVKGVDSVENNLIVKND